VDSDLLAEARRAQERLIDAERDADVARADFHRAVRRLHLHGASLRELAGTLGLSHQRVHQIVEAAGGSRRWLRGGHKSRSAPARADMPTARPKMTCTFCGRDQTQTSQIIAGTNVGICDICVALARDAITSRPPPGGPFLPVTFMRGDSPPECEPDIRMACSFCGAQVHQVTALAISSGTDYTAPGRASRPVICVECLDLCDEILAEDPPGNGNPA
jgi:ClpX C4-type zinc finger protein